MRFKNQQRAPMPVVDLIPMLNVMMAVLAFFVTISMTLANPQGVDVQLPSGETTSATEEEAPDPLIVEFNREGQITINDQTVTQEQLFGQMQAYLTENPKGAVLLNADPQLPYEQVVQLLGQMRDVGGDRVSLGIETEPENAAGEASGATDEGQS
jgi:biopolymer transport protein ExbD